MTIPFTPITKGWLPAMSDYSPTLYSTAPASPFSTRSPSAPPTIQVARVGKDNLAKLAFHALRMSDGAVWVPADRCSITIGDKRFDLGEWIVEDYNVSGMVNTYRHATEEEASTYGLTPLKLEG